MNSHAVDGCHFYDPLEARKNGERVINDDELLERTATHLAWSAIVSATVESSLVALEFGRAAADSGTTQAT